MGQICPVLVSVSFTLKSVTKLNSVKHLRSRTHLDTVVRAPAWCPRFVHPLTTLNNMRVVIGWTDNHPTSIWCPRFVHPLTTLNNMRVVIGWTDNHPTRVDRGWIEGG